MHCFKEGHYKIYRSSCYLKTIDPHNYLLMTLNGKILGGLFEHERLKPANIRTSQGNIQNLVQLKQIMHAGFKI